MNVIVVPEPGTIALAAARRQAAERGTTLTAFVEHALAASLARRATTDKPFRLEWKTHHGATMLLTENRDFARRKEWIASNCAGQHSLHDRR